MTNAELTDWIINLNKRIEALENLTVCSNFNNEGEAITVTLKELTQKGK